MLHTIDNLKAQQICIDDSNTPPTILVEQKLPTPITWCTHNYFTSKPQTNLLLKIIPNHPNIFGSIQNS